MKAFPNEKNKQSIFFNNMRIKLDTHFEFY
jgi:hypothetical protein